MVWITRLNPDFVSRVSEIPENTIEYVTHCLLLITIQHKYMKNHTIW